MGVTEAHKPALPQDLSLLTLRLLPELLGATNCRTAIGIVAETFHMPRTMAEMIGASGTPHVDVSCRGRLGSCLVLRSTSRTPIPRSPRV